MNFASVTITVQAIMNVIIGTQTNAKIYTKLATHPNQIPKYLRIIYTNMATNILNIIALIISIPPTSSSE